LEEAFEQAVVGMFGYMTELEKVEIDESKTNIFEVEGHDYDSLLQVASFGALLGCIATSADNINTASQLSVSAFLVSFRLPCHFVPVVVHNSNFLT
jgi:SHS2 domain-containing protein